ncbi:unnamed protein product, partial [Mesorhabditis belari]|uniref:Regulatory protein zeste n=1 Tax=Mesorhabditis belari TaxID=2138241 RepID=A0AAF3EIL4_9BILA
MDVNGRGKTEDLPLEGLVALIGWLIENWEEFHAPQLITPQQGVTAKQKLWKQWSEALGEMGIFRTTDQVRKKINGELKVVRNRILFERQGHQQAMKLNPARKLLYDFLMLKDEGKESNGSSEQQEVEASIAKNLLKFNPIDYADYFVKKETASTPSEESFDVHKLLENGEPETIIVNRNVSPEAPPPVKRPRFNLTSTHSNHKESNNRPSVIESSKNEIDNVEDAKTIEKTILLEKLLKTKAERETAQIELSTAKLRHEIALLELERLKKQQEKNIQVNGNI